MLYLYDEAIAADLTSCINPSSGAESVVKVIDPEGVMPLVAQIKEDKIKFPLICLKRDPYTADTTRTNFTAQQIGFPVVVDPEKHLIYNERSIPIKLSYSLTVLATNIADMDEIVREIMFHYLNTFFVTLNLPYESNRKIRFGVDVDEGSIEQSSASLEYLQSGKLYESRMTLNCQGAVLLTYTPKHLERLTMDTIQIDEHVGITTAGEVVNL